MSTKRGGDRRKRAQKHKNETAFKNNKYDSNAKAKVLNQLKVVNVCHKCKVVIEWKIKYDKYKPLTAPKKCVKCDEKKVKFAYHIACTQCANKEKICAKCIKHCDVVEEPAPDAATRQREEAHLRDALKAMPLREQKTFWRQVERDRMASEKGSLVHGSSCESDNHSQTPSLDAYSDDEKSDANENSDFDNELYQDEIIESTREK